MPKLDGFEFLKKLNTDPDINNIPVAVLSALWQEEDKKRALSLGAVIYMVKSETMPKQVVEMLLQIIDKHQAQTN